MRWQERYMPGPFSSLYTGVLCPFPKRLRDYAPLAHPLFAGGRPLGIWVRGSSLYVCRIVPRLSRDVPGHGVPGVPTGRIISRQASHLRSRGSRCRENVNLPLMPTRLQVLSRQLIRLLVVRRSLFLLIQRRHRLPKQKFSATGEPMLLIATTISTDPGHDW
jgi:hypothetical protein